MSGAGGGFGTVPAGWYRNYDGSETMRYWDGAQWTDHVRPLPPEVQPGPARAAVPGAGDAGPAESPSVPGEPPDVPEGAQERPDEGVGSGQQPAEPGPGAGAGWAQTGQASGPPGGFAGAPPAAPQEQGDSGEFASPEQVPPDTGAATTGLVSLSGTGYPPPGASGYPIPGAPGYPPYAVPGYPPYGLPSYPGQAGHTAAAQTNTLAILSLIASLVWLCGVGSLIGVITGHVSRHQIKRSGGLQGGAGVALAGLIVGYLGLAAVVGGVALMLLVGSSTNVEGQIEDAFADAAVRIDLEDAATAQEAWYQENGAYTSSVADLESVGFFSLDGSVYEGGEPKLEILAAETGYCVQATAASGRTFHHDSDSGPGDGPCPSAQGSSAGRTES